MGGGGQLMGEGLPAADRGGEDDESMAGQGGGVLGVQFMGMGGTSPIGVVGGTAPVDAPTPVTPTPALAAGQLAEGAGGAVGLEGLLADDGGPLGAGVDADAVMPYPSWFVGNLVPASLAGAAAVPDFTDVGVGGVAGVPADSDGGNTEMGAAGGMPGDLTAVVNAPVGPAAGGGFGGGFGGVRGEGRWARGLRNRWAATLPTTLPALTWRLCGTCEGCLECWWCGELQLHFSIDVDARVVRPSFRWEVRNGCTGGAARGGKLGGM